MRFLLASIFFFLFLPTTYAATYTWVGGSGSAWETTANWDVGGSYPDGVDDDAIINVNSDAITLTGPLTIKSLTLNGTYAGTLTVNGALTIGDSETDNGTLTVNEGTINHPDNSTAETYKLIINVNGDFTLGANGSINVELLGYDKDQGPGAPPNSSDDGGGHGGMGGDGSGGTDSSSATYGSITAPTNIGSGGDGRSGGGAIQVTVTGDSIINGNMSATASATYWADQGAGGSVYLTTGTLDGSGTIQANGGQASSGQSGGGGGRVAVILTSPGATFADFDVAGTISAYGGYSNGNRHGTAGTVYRENYAQGVGGADNGELIFDNNTRSIGINTPIHSSLSEFPTGSIALRGNANVEIESGVSMSPTSNTLNLEGTSSLTVGSGATLDLTGGTLTGDANTSSLKLSGGTFTTSSIFNYTNLNLWITATSTFSPSTSLTVGAGSILTSDVPHTFGGNMIIQNNGTVTHSTNNTAETYKLRFNLT